MKEESRHLDAWHIEYKPKEMKIRYKKYDFDSHKLEKATDTITYLRVFT